MSTSVSPDLEIPKQPSAKLSLGKHLWYRHFARHETAVRSYEVRDNHPSGLVGSVVVEDDERVNPPRYFYGNKNFIEGMPLGTAYVSLFDVPDRITLVEKEDRAVFYFDYPSDEETHALAFQMEGRDDVTIRIGRYSGRVHEIHLLVSRIGVLISGEGLPLDVGKAWWPYVRTDRSWASLCRHIECLNRVLYVYGNSCIEALSYAEDEE